MVLATGPTPQAASTPAGACPPASSAASTPSAAHGAPASGSTATATSTSTSTSTSTARYTTLKRRNARRVFVLFALAALVVWAFLAGLAIGPLGYGLGDVAAAIASPDSVDAQLRSVVWGLRLPPALLAVLVGAALAVGGLQMQTILDNPLAEPFTLGVSAAAAFGAALAIVLGISLPIGPQHTLTVFAGGAALLTAVLISAVSMWRGASTETVVLFGIAMVFGFQALLSLMQYRASTESLQQIVFWSMGSMQRATWTAVAVVGACLAVAVPWFALNGWRLTAMRFGDSRARALGVNVTRLRVVSLVVVSLLAAVAVSFVGIIGFVGLVAPHVARVLVGEDQRFLLPGSILCGSTLLAGAHALSLVVVPGVAVPVGILTATIGVPVFVAIVLLRRRTAFGGGR